MKLDLDNLPDYLTTGEVAEYLRKSIRTIEKLVHNKKLGATRTGPRSYSISKKHLRDFIDENDTIKN